MSTKNAHPQAEATKDTATTKAPKLRLAKESVKVLAVRTSVRAGDLPCVATRGC